MGPGQAEGGPVSALDGQSAAGQPPEGGQPAGWLVTDPDGNVVQAGPQTVTEASTGAGQEQ